MSTTSTYTVSGMTCSHCAMSVTEEISQLSDGTNVEVDLGSGQVIVSSASDLDPTRVQEAVEEAGYQLVNS